MTSLDFAAPAPAPVTVEPELGSCAEEVLHLLAAHGIEILFLNPGTDSAPLQEAHVALTGRGVPVPRLILSSFEGVALAAALGHFQASGRPQAVFVHVDSGTQNLGAMVHNSLRDHAGAVVLAGKTPYGEDADAPGGRDTPIHWYQDMPDQAGIVRGYAKWCGELTRAHDTARVIGRAVQVAAGGIPGLTYLTLSRDVLMDPAGPASLRRATRFARPRPAGAEPAGLTELAERLAHAERPLIITNRTGRYPGGPEALQRLSELAAIPVAGRPEAVNLVTSSPLCVRSLAHAATLMAEADVLVVVDCDVPWIPRHGEPAADCFIAQIDRDPVRADMPLWSFPIDLALTADPGVALAQLHEALAAHADSAGEGWERRRAELAPAVAASTEATRAAASAPDISPGDVRAVLSALDDALGDDWLVVEEAVSNSGTLAELLDRPQAGTMFSAGGPGLGWAPGASVGIKLVHPDRPVVAVMGDGAFFFGVPTAALSLAAEAQAPIVIVVLNNNGYRASRLPVLSLYPEGVSAREADDGAGVVGTRFVQPPDIVALAEACGAWGARTEGAEGLREALAEAVEHTRRGRSAVIDVRVDQAP
jgi:acetolactate synthase I/II/III large subunit